MVKTSSLTTLVCIVLLVLFTLPAIAALLKPGYYPSHDGAGHIIRLSEFDISLKDGQIPVRMDKNLMYGYGYYFFNFNYPLVYWLGEAFHLTGFDFVDSIKIVSILGLILSGLAMFFWQKSHWGNWGGFLAGIFYMYAPYRLLNLYVRGSLAEHLAFIFLPLLFMFTEKIAEGDRRQQLTYVLLGGISYGALMLVHNITAFIFTLVLGIFMLFHILLYRRFRLIVNFALVGIIGLCLSAFFWIPSLLEKKYVRLDQTIGQDYPSHFVNFFQLIQRSWGYGSNDMSLQIGLFHWGAVLLAIAGAAYLYHKHRQKALHLFLYLGILTISIFLMLIISKPVWEHFPLLPFTQFPWRFLSWSVFAASVLAGGIIYVAQNYLGTTLKKIVPVLVIFIAGFLITTSYYYYQPSEIISVKPPGDQPMAGSTTWADEQFPVWFNPKPTSLPLSHVEFIEGIGGASINQWKTGLHNYVLNNLSLVRVVENTAYYPGWKVYVDGTEVPVNYQDNKYPGRMVFSVPGGQHNIVSKFTETPLRLTVDIISLVSLIVVILLLIIPFKFKISN